VHFRNDALNIKLIKGLKYFCASDCSLAKSKDGGFIYFYVLFLFRDILCNRPITQQLIKTVT